MKKISILIVMVLVLASCQRVFDNPWDPKNLVYQVIYQAPNAESGNVPVDSQKYSRGMQAIVLGNPGGLYRDGKTLNFWQINNQQLFPGDSFAVQETTTLTGIWKDSGRAQFSLSTSLASNTSYLYGVETAPDGSIYAVGYIQGIGNFQFGTKTVFGPNSNSIALIVKLTPQERFSGQNPSLQVLARHVIMKLPSMPVAMCMWLELKMEIACLLMNQERRPRLPVPHPMPSLLSIRQPGMFFG